METIIIFLSYLAVVSVAAERFTEILKGVFLAKYANKAVVYQIVAGLFGAGLCYLSPPTVDIGIVNEYVKVIIVGFVVSGGSGLINDLLSTLKTFQRNIKTQ